MVDQGDLSLPKPEETIPKFTKKLEEIDPPKPPKLPPAVPQDSSSVGGAIEDAGQQVLALPAPCLPAHRVWQTALAVCAGPCQAVAGQIGCRSARLQITMQHLGQLCGTAAARLLQPGWVHAWEMVRACAATALLIPMSSRFCVEACIPALAPQQHPVPIQDSHRTRVPTGGALSSSS